MLPLELVYPLFLPSLAGRGEVQGYISPAIGNSEIEFPKLNKTPKGSVKGALWAFLAKHLARKRWEEAQGECLKESHLLSHTEVAVPALGAQAPLAQRAGGRLCRGSRAGAGGAGRAGGRGPAVTPLTSAGPRERGLAHRGLTAGGTPFRKGYRSGREGGGAQPGGGATAARTA